MAWQTVTFTIAAGQSVSDSVELTTGGRMALLQVPSAWDAAPVTFQVSADGLSWSNFYIGNLTNTATEATIPQINGGVAVNLIDRAPARFLRLRSGTAGAPVVQAAARKLILQLEV